MGVYDNGQNDIRALFGGPGFAALPFSFGLFSRKKGHAMLCQTCMNLAAGIVVGTVNRLQFNEWQTKGFCGRRLWQLIAIFDKVNQFPVADGWLLEKNTLNGRLANTTDL